MQKKKQMGKIKGRREFFEKYSLFLLGLFICLFFIFFRLIRRRVPGEITFSWNIILFLLYLFLFISSCYYFKQKFYPRESKNEGIIFLKENLSWIYIYYISSLQNVYHIIRNFRINNRFYFAEIFHRIGKIIEKVVRSNFYYHYRYRKLSEYFYNCVTVIPRLILSIFFCIDFIYNHEIKLLYKFGWVILIPFFWNIFIFCLTEYMMSGYFTSVTFFDIEETPYFNENGDEDYNYSWKRKENPYFDGEILKLSEEDYLEMENLITHFRKLANSKFIGVFGSAGLLKETSSYEKIQLSSSLIFCITFGYIIIKMLINATLIQIIILLIVLCFYLIQILIILLSFKNKYII